MSRDVVPLLVYMHAGISPRSQHLLLDGKAVGHIEHSAGLRQQYLQACAHRDSLETIGTSNLHLQVEEAKI